MPSFAATKGVKVLKLDCQMKKTDTLLPILSQISKLQENVEQLLKENTELKKAIEFNNNCEIEDLKK